MGVGGQCVEISNLSLEHRCTHFFFEDSQARNINILLLYVKLVLCMFWCLINCFEMFFKSMNLYYSSQTNKYRVFETWTFYFVQDHMFVILYIFLIILYTWRSILIYISFHSTHDMSCFWMTQMVPIHGFLFRSLTAITKVFFHFFVCYDMPWW